MRRSTSFAQRVNYEEDEFVSADLMNQNLQNARNAYLKKHGCF